MTRRERLESKLEKRAQWAEARTRKASAAMKAADKIASFIPPGQPILVGHHSEKRHRRDLDRIASNMDSCVENRNMAEYHRGKAAGLQYQLENTIFSDDENALEAIAQKIKELEDSQAYMVGVNKICKSKKLSDTEKAEQIKANFPKLNDEIIDSLLHPQERWMGIGFASYALSNNRANIRRYQQRYKEVKERQERQQRAEQASNGVLIEGSTWVRITFPEKPDYDIIRALKAAGFRWRGGSWNGERVNIPDEVTELAELD